MIMKERLTITIDQETLDKLDEARGLVPRSTYIDYHLKKYIEELKKND